MGKSIPKDQMEETKKRLINAIKLAEPPEISEGFENLPFDLSWGDLNMLFLSIEKRLSSKDANLGKLIAALTLPRWKIKKATSLTQPNNPKMVVIINSKTYLLDERIWIE